MDAMEQLTTQVIPTLIEKMKQQKTSIEQQSQYINEYAEAFRKIHAVMKTYKERIEKLEEEVAALKAQPAPEVKVKRASRKKKEAAPAAPKGERFGETVVANITGDDILAANYALAATKGDVNEACMLMPDIDRTRMDIISRMNSEQVREIVAASPITITNIDAKYVTGRWDELSE